MNIIETLLVFAGIPIGLVLVLAVAVYGKTAVNQNRYRPGRPWTYDPVWFLPHPEGAPAYKSAAAAALPVGSSASSDDSERMGGASGEW